MLARRASCVGVALLPLVKQVPFVKALVDGARDRRRAARQPARAAADCARCSGIWPAKDFRVDPTSIGATTVLIAIVVARRGVGDRARASSAALGRVLAYGGVLLAAAAILAAVRLAMG